MSNTYLTFKCSNYRRILKIASKFAVIIFFLFSGNNLIGQECDELVCNGDLQISLGIECQLVVTPDMVLEAPASEGNYIIEFFETDGSSIGDTLTADQSGKTLTYQVTCSGNSCWGKATIETNIIPDIQAPCACTETGVIPEECNFWCSADISTPDIIFSVEEATALFGECGPDLIGNIIVEETRVGDLCSQNGETITIIYKAKVRSHGRVEEIELLCQKYTIEKLDIEDDAFFNDHFSFPIDVNLNCSIVTNTSPSALSTLGVASAFPYYIDVHNPVLNTSLVCDRIQIEVITGTHEEMVEQEVGGEIVWTLVTVVDKTVRDSSFNCRFEPVLDLNGNQTMSNRLVPIDEAVCNIISSYSDIEFDACGNSKKIFRDWNLIDWCDNSVVRSERQVIEVVDVTPPSFFPINDQFVSIEPWTCSAKVRLPFPFVNDICGGEITREFKTLEGRVEEGYLLDLWIDQSPINVTFVATDECGNEATDEFMIIIRDDVNPVAICEVELQVHLTNGIDGSESLAKIYAESFDEGSHDAGCGDVTLQVVRMEDWMDAVIDCEGEVIGYQPVSCHVQSSTIDAGLIEDFKGDTCSYNGTNIVEITQLGDFVKFCCNDVGRDDLFVILIATDAAGNTNQCMIKVDVINLQAPTLVCQDVEIDCNESLDEVPGPQVIGGNCTDSAYEIILSDESDMSGTCGNGVITKEWFLDMDGDGELGPFDIVCEQFIFISNESSRFNPYSLKWPKHYNGTSVIGTNLECDPEGNVVETAQTIDLGESMNCMPDSESGQKPIWCDTNCGLVGYSMEQDTIQSGDACLKVIKRWTVIDWCLYESNGEGVDDENDTDADQFEVVEDWAQGVCADCDNGYGPVHDDAVYLRYTAVDEDGYYTYDQIIKVIDDTKPVINIDEPIVYVDILNGAISKDDNTICSASSTISASASDFCDVFEVDGASLTWEITVTNGSGEPVYDINGESIYYGTGTSATITTAEGSSGDIFTVEWIVYDACGNSEWAATTVIFQDAKPPTPFCISGLTTAYTDIDGNVTVWGKEFDFGSFDNCCPADDLRFTIVRAGDTPAQPGEPEFNEQAGITFYCEEISNFSQLDVWVWDCDGNGDFCRVSILVSGECGSTPDNGDGSGGMIAGGLSTEIGDFVEGAAIRILTNLPEYPNTMVTANDGNYAFANNPLGYNYKVQAAKDGDDSNGVSTLDLVLIQRHIIGNELLDSPYKVIAADVSNDQRISSLDLFEIKKLILGISDSFDNTDSWIFVDTKQQFSDIENPWPLETEKNIIGLNQDQMNEDFIGIKKGDVNNNAAANRFVKVDTRSDLTLDFRFKEELTNHKGQIEIPVFADNFNEVYGFQMGMNHEGYELADIVSNAIEIHETDFAHNGNQTNILWFKDTMKSVARDQVLFTMLFDKVSTENSTGINQVLQLAESRFNQEAYIGLDKEIIGLKLIGQESKNLPVFSQNSPNPFTYQSDITFYLPVEGNVDLKIKNASGQIILNHKSHYNSGNHVIQILKDMLPSSGVYYYTMKFKNTITTRKMVHIQN